VGRIGRLRADAPSLANADAHERLPAVSVDAAAQLARVARASQNDRGEGDDGQSRHDEERYSFNETTCAAGKYFPNPSALLPTPDVDFSSRDGENPDRPRLSL
jgi:hypothetical protein